LPPLALQLAVSQSVSQSVNSTNVHAADHLGPLPAELSAELSRLEHMFAVDGAKLRAISAHFENELRRGLSRYGLHYLIMEFNLCGSFTEIVCVI
jgi:hypothetical protein